MIADEIAEYAYQLRYSDLSDGAIHQVQRHFIDAVGCAIAARNSPPVKVIKSTYKLDSFLPMNAFLYGSMIRYLDYNDTYLSKEPAHPSDNFGAVLAVGESIRAKPKDFLTAAALAYEIQCRLCDMASLRASGWDHVIYGSISTAAASGKLLGLNQEQIKQAIQISLASSISTRQVREATELSMWKAAAFANVAKNGVMAAMLAKKGMTGPNEMFEGTYGMMNQLTGNFKFRTSNWGWEKSRFKIEDCWLKKWPAEIHSQSAIEGAIKLRSEVRDISKIKKVIIETHEAGYTIIGSGKQKWHPKTRETADHSLPYIVAAALYTGKINKNTFTPKVMNNKGIRKLLKKVTVKENRYYTSEYPKAAMNKVKLRLPYFNNMEAEVKYQRGHSQNKMTDAEIEQKFNTLTNNALTFEQKKRMLRSILVMDKHKTCNLKMIRSVL